MRDSTTVSIICLASSWCNHPSRRSVVKVNSNSEELRPEQAHRPRVRCAARQLFRQSALALKGIIVRKQILVVHLIHP